VAYALACMFGSGRPSLMIQGRTGMGYSLHKGALALLTIVSCVTTGWAQTPTPTPGCTDDTWTATNATNAPTARSFHTAVWTGGEMIVWGGQDNFGYSNTGSRYNPGTDSWAATTATNSPTARAWYTTVWTGSEMIVWGGYGNSGFLNTGGRYNPATDSWTTTSTTNRPTARISHTAVWTGSEMLVWGGYDGAGELNTGRRYNPTTNTWTTISTINAPARRDYHSAVWTGSEMLVWGGSGSGYGGGDLNTGGRYNPATDTWTPISTINAPTGRLQCAAVWTGSEMIVWGGFGGPFGGASYFNTGGRYNPDTNGWTATTTNDAPIARAAPRVIWTGGEMILWGGYAYDASGAREGGYFNIGGRYNPDTNGWTATTTNNAPFARTNHTAVWTGSGMIVWGGGHLSHLNTGGRYCAQPLATPTPSPTPPCSREQCR